MVNHALGKSLKQHNRKKAFLASKNGQKYLADKATQELGHSGKIIQYEA